MTPGTDALNVSGLNTVLLAVPDDADNIVAQLKGLNNMWGYLLTMAGFVNSFFLSQACARARLCKPEGCGVSVHSLSHYLPRRILNNP